MSRKYQCKCGAPLELMEDGKTAKCAYCGATVVFPKAGFQRMIAANEMRQRREFDQAEGIYRSLTIAFPDDPEIWWCILLCEYGIEYVKEIKDGVEKTIPTINRMKYESIFEQEAYQKAIALADEESKRIYQAEAQKIEDIQKGLQKIVAKEEKYDVFISFKEKDDITGERTLDSVLAQEIYDALTKEGYKVFFSRITLRKMVGQEFEPKIFAALHSAAMMIVVGCKKEHMESTWVKNEWSRYLKLMEKDADKYLLPVYAYKTELPEQIAPIEGIEANGVNYMKLILKNVGERIGYKKEIRQNEELVNDVVLLEQDEVRRITERGFNALRVERNEQADEYFEQALDINVAYAPAWWGKLANITQDFEIECDIFEEKEMNHFYQQAMKYATEEEKAGFEADLRRYENNQQKFQAEHLFEKFLEETNNLRLVFSDGTPEEDKIHRTLIKKQEYILSLLESDPARKEELASLFADYNRKQERVKGLKKEFLQIEKENQRKIDQYLAINNYIVNAREQIKNAKDTYRLRLWVILAVLVIPNTIALTFAPDSENLWILYIICGLSIYKIWKNTKMRNKCCGGSMEKLEKSLKEKEVEKQNRYSEWMNRYAKLPKIYKELYEKYIDVKGYVIPKDINAHITVWGKQITK